MKVTPQSVDPTNGGIPFLTVQQTIAAKPILMDTQGPIPCDQRYRIPWLHQVKHLIKH